MKTYEKIETLYQRDVDGTKKLMLGVYRDPTVEFLKDNIWEWTEKVDGTNVRVHWDGHSVTFGGRTERASIPALLVNRLNNLFGGEENAQLFEQLFGEREVILFGEGYGSGIQSAGKAYNPNGVDFILFDLMIGENYQPRESVERCAESFDIRAVPVVGEGTLEEAVTYVKSNPRSRLGEIDMEGIVCRPKQELRDRCGKRIICKIKWGDMKEIVKQISTSHTNHNENLEAEIEHITSEEIAGFYERYGIGANESDEYPTIPTAFDDVPVRSKGSVDEKLPHEYTEWIAEKTKAQQYFERSKHVDQ